MIVFWNSSKPLSRTDEKHNDVEEVNIEHAEVVMRSGVSRRKSIGIRLKCAKPERDVRNGSLLIFQRPGSHGPSDDVFIKGCCKVSCILLTGKS